MKVQVLAMIAVCFGLTLFAWAQEKSAEPAGKAKIDADSIESINQYVGNQLRAAFAQARQDPKQALKMMDELAAALDELKPTQPQSKQLVTYAKAAVKRYRTQIQLQMTTLDELLAKLKANPIDATTIELYGMKILQEAGPFASSEPERAEKKMNEAKKFLTDLREKVKDNADAVKAIDQAEAQFDQVDRMIASAKKLKELIGKDATATHRRCLGERRTTDGQRSQGQSRFTRFLGRMVWPVCFNVSPSARVAGKICRQGTRDDRCHGVLQLYLGCRGRAGQAVGGQSHRSPGTGDAEAVCGA